VINVALLAWAGVPRAQVERIAEGAAAIGFGGVQSAGQAALAARDLAEGLYDEAFERLLPLVEDPFLQVTPTEYPDFVEAGARSGRTREVIRYVGLLEDMARANGSAWNRGLAERSRALVSGAGAEPLFRAALDHLRADAIEVEVARTHLLLGEWLRRARRRREAAEHLRRAVHLFEHCEAPAFTERARNELEAAGGRPGGESTSPGADLTVQEMTVARLAASGNTNAEIGATMFLSPNTVDYHLRKVFRKLGVSSRRQLSDRLSLQG
jgi:DNA-binding CsgD family transcriptional regulator